MHSGGSRSSVEAGAPSFAAILSSEVRHSAPEQILLGRSVDPLGKVQISGGCFLGKTCSVCKHNDFARGNDACHFGDTDEGVGSLLGKGKMKSLLWAWKDQLSSL